MTVPHGSHASPTAGGELPAALSMNAKAPNTHVPRSDRAVRQGVGGWTAGRGAPLPFLCLRVRPRFGGKSAQERW